MKKLLLILLPAMLLMALPAAAASEPVVVDLMAGQHTDAGDVRVWNDSTSLYVQFVPQNGWCISETHVAVETSLEDIPQNKGNPPPGKFEFQAEYSPCSMDPVGFTIPRTWPDGTELFIAAHAVVGLLGPVDGCSETEWLIGYAETPDCPTEGGGLLTNYADEFNWTGASACAAGPGLAANEPAYTSPFIVGSTPLNEFPYNSNFIRGYATDFDVQWTGGLPFGGELVISWSPGKSAAEMKVVTNGFGTETISATGTPRPGEGWFLDTYPLVENSIAVPPTPDGTHTINFQHTKGDGTFWDYIWLKKPCEAYEWETGWGAGLDFPGKNWATYFNYTIQLEPVCPSILATSANVETLSSPPPDVNVGAYENDSHVRLWKEYFGPLAAPLAYDLGKAGRSAKEGPWQGLIPAGEYVCSYYLHLDNVGPSSTVQHTGFVVFDTDIDALIISGGDLGDFAGINAMFFADAQIGYSGTSYPSMSGVNYWRGFDVNYGSNLDDAVFDGGRVDFTMWVVNAHDSMRVILPAKFW